MMHSTTKDKPLQVYEERRKEYNKEYKRDSRANKRGGIPLALPFCSIQHA